MSTPRFIRKQNPVIVGFLLRTTRIYSFGTLLTLVFGVILAGMTHKFSQWWISVSLTLFVVAFVLLVLIMRDQRKALAALHRAAKEAADGAEESARAGVADAADGSAQPVAEGDRPAAGDAQPAIGDGRPAPRAALLNVAAVERGRITSIGGVTALIWLVILVLMAWH
jgi:hypothetical protein